MNDTNKQYDQAVARCRAVYDAKMGDYGPSWRLMRPSTLTDQLFIKAKRMRTVQNTGINLVGEDQTGDFMALVNYSVIGLIQIELGFSDQTHDISRERALELYDHYISQAKRLMANKNHDYDEAWRDMRVSSITDMILNKICRNKEIEENDGVTHVSEGVEGNLYDIINYAIFGLILLNEAA